MDERRSDIDLSLTKDDDSGLIDLRALMAACAAPPVDAERERDEVIHTVTSWHVLAPPVVPPVSYASRRPWLAGALIASAVLSLSLVAFAALPRMIDREAREAGEAAARGGASRLVVSTHVEPMEDVTAPIVDVVPAREVVPPVDAIERPRAPTTGTRPRIAAVPSAPRPRPATEVAPAITPTGAAIDPTLASLIDDALAGGSSGGATSALPSSPSQLEVRTALRALERSVALCREGDGAMISTRLTIDGATGRVTNVDVRGIAVGAEVECVTRAVQGARFSPFAREQFVVSYPFRV